MKNAFFKTYSLQALLVQLISGRKQKMSKKTVSMRLLWKSIKCYTDNFKNKKMFFLTLLNSINFLPKYFESFENLNVFLKFCTLYTLQQKFLPKVVKCALYKIWAKHLKFLTTIFEIFLEQVNWIQKCKKKHFFVFKVICVTFYWFSK